MDALFEIFKLRYYSLIEESKQSRNFEEKLHKLDQAIKICPIPSSLLLFLSFNSSFKKFFPQNSRSLL